MNVKFVGFQNHSWVFHISLHIVSNSDSAVNFTQLSCESFLRRPNGSELKLCLKIAEIKFSYVAKILPWLKRVGGKIQPHAKG